MLIRTRNFFIKTCKKTMSVFASKVNVTTGQIEWVPMDDAFDYSQQIARSAYADMLHDKDRNMKYYDALKIAVRKVKNSGKKAIVLDIGTGTGILSMMAASCGADYVYACEFFGPMSRCAERIIRLNKLDHKIKVIHKGSTQLTVGEGKDLPCRANILVTEVFDTELIGEGAFRTYTHAQKELLEEDAIYIPSAGRVYASVFESELVNKFNKVEDQFVDSNNQCSIRIPDLIKNCPGCAAVHDIQLSEVPMTNIKMISDPEIVFRFDWSGKTPLKKTERKTYVLKAKCSAVAHGVFMWWDLLMDPDGEIILSCAPKWARTSEEDYSWRDHWMQAVYYFPKNPKLEGGQEFTLITNHDEFALWFNINKDKDIQPNNEVPVCECGLHLTSRQRIGMINDRSRQSKFMRLLRNNITENVVCLSLSECSFLGLYVASLGAKKVYCYETNRIFQTVFENIAKFNNLHSRLEWVSSPEELKNSLSVNKEKISFVLAEPYFSSSILPWHNMQFWFLKNQLSEVLHENVFTVPYAAEFFLMPVEFLDLWKIRAPVKKVEGFNLKPFDEIIQEAITVTDDMIDAQPLWEYPCVALSQPQSFMKLNFTDSVVEDIQSTNEITFETNGICNGIVLWVNWLLSADDCISTGPVDNVTVGKNVSWDMYSKQGVYFIKTKTEVSPSNLLSYSINFHVVNGSFEYNFKIL